ncbi:cytosolic protein [Calothrix sp. CCY 0018]|uniref:cytosolic protein n=1 Tax=Calothrix sp. CCY 0018 TaxID=3103864 RepID=UPI0039C684D3
MTNPNTEYDSPWKEIIQLYFEDFMLFFFPQVHSQIDWSRGFEFLDQELQQVVRDAELGKRLVDKLVKIYRIGGEESWLLIHLEVQAQEENEFPQRMFVYNYRIYDKYKKPVASLAVLGDSNRNWRPNQFGYELFGCSVDFRFAVVKLVDYQQRKSELEESRNPFATVVLAHLTALETQENRDLRKARKLALVRRLYEKEFSREQVLNLLAFLDWMLTLPLGLEQEFRRDLELLEVQKGMQYITSFERSGIEKGKQEALLKGIEISLEVKFGSEGLNLLPEISQIDDVTQLENILEGIKTESSVSELREIYQPTTGE